MMPCLVPVTQHQFQNVLISIAIKETHLNDLGPIKKDSAQGIHAGMSLPINISCSRKPSSQVAPTLSPEKRIRAGFIAWCLRDP